MARDYAALPHEYLLEMEELGDAEFGRLCRALLEYSMSGTPIALNGNERFYSRRVMMREDRYKESYEKTMETNRNNGKKGGRPKKTTGFSEQNKKPTGFSENPRVFEETQKTQTESESETKTNLLSAAAATRTRAKGAFAYYQDKIGYDMSREAMSLLPQYIQDMGDDVVIAAIDEALDHGAHSWSYVKPILQNWSKAKVHDMDSLNRHRDGRKRQQPSRRVKNGPAPASQMAQPDPDALEENQRQLKALLASVEGTGGTQ